MILARVFITLYYFVSKTLKIEWILLKIQQSLYFLLFSLYFTHYFVHYLRMNLADNLSVFWLVLECDWVKAKINVLLNGKWFRTPPSIATIYVTPKCNIGGSWQPVGCRKTQHWWQRWDVEKGSKNATLVAAVGCQRRNNNMFSL